jgi:hypothetical protein
MPTETSPKINYVALVEAVRRYNDSQGEKHPVLSHFDAYTAHPPLTDSMREVSRQVGVDLNPRPSSYVVDSIKNGLDSDPELADRFGHFHGVPD